MLTQAMGKPSAASASAASRQPLAADAGEQREAAVADDVERRHAGAVLLEPRMRQAGAGEGRVLIDELRVVGEGRARLAAGIDRGRVVALVHVDAVRVELVDLERDRLAQRLAALLATSVSSLRDCMLAFITSGSVDSSRPERAEDRAELADRLVGAVDDLLADRRALRVVAVEQRWATPAP